MGKDHLTALLLLFAVALLPVLAWGIWRILKQRQLRKAAIEMRRGNEVYGEWKRSRHDEMPPEHSGANSP